MEDLYRHPAWQIQPVFHRVIAWVAGFGIHSPKYPVWIEREGRIALQLFASSQGVICQGVMIAGEFLVLIVDFLLIVIVQIVPSALEDVFDFIHLDHLDIFFILTAKVSYP